MKKLALISMIAGASGLGAAASAQADVLSVQLQILGGSSGEKIPVLQIETETCGHAYPSVVVADARKLLDGSAVLELKSVPECTVHTQGTANFSVPIGTELAQLGLDPETAKLFWQESGKPGDPRPVDPRNLYDATGVAKITGTEMQPCSTLALPSAQDAEDQALRDAETYCAGQKPVRVSAFKYGTNNCVWGGPRYHFPSNFLYAQARFRCE